jgi:hypothetical protein
MNAPLVCATGPPGNGNGVISHTPIPKLTPPPGAYHVAALGQAGTVWQRWEREARRLFVEYWLTGNQKHLGAFVRHVAAMRVYGGPR